MKYKSITVSMATISLIGMISTTSAFAATKTTSTTPPSFPHHGFGHGAGSGLGFMGSLPTILKLSSTTLQADLKSGKSILQIAQKQGISEKALISDMEKDDQAQLGKLVASKKITAAKEKQIIQQYDSHISKMITNTRKAK